MSLIEVQNLSRLFVRGDEEIRALDSVSLTINKGEFLAVVGPSGSGKSTLMYILGLLDQQTEGEYLLEGRSTSELSDNERSKLRNQKIGFVFQSFHLLPRATALRNVTMPLVYSAAYDSNYSDNAATTVAKEALRQVGLETRMTHLPNELSGGQRQRVAIARALVNAPAIILADEPTGNLDSKNGREILQLFTNLNEQGVTVMLVTHDMEVAKSAKRIVTFRDGKIVGDEMS